MQGSDFFFFLRSCWWQDKEYIECEADAIIQVGLIQVDAAGIERRILEEYLCVCVCVYVCVCVLKLCPTLCDPMDCSHQAPLYMGYSRQEYWSGLPLPPPGIFLAQGLNPCPLHWQAGSLPPCHLGGAVRGASLHMLTWQSYQLQEKKRSHGSLWGAKNPHFYPLLGTWVDNDVGY